MFSHMCERYHILSICSRIRLRKYDVLPVLSCQSEEWDSDGYEEVQGDEWDSDEYEDAADGFEVEDAEESTDDFYDTSTEETLEEDEQMMGQYICPRSDTKKLTVKQVKKLSKAKRRLAKNEIYARHGRKFLDQNLQEYFDNQDWYVGIIEPDEFDESVFNKVEKYNVRLLAKYE